MNKNELKKMLKPLIKQCIKEVLFEEDGALSHIISEVAVGLSGAPKTVVKESNRRQPEKNKKAADKLKQRKKKLLDAIGKETYGGVNIFEGTTPAPSPSSRGQGPLSGTDPNDAGVDISNLFSSKSAAIHKQMTGKK
tara:strand:- start:11 stop:421 length:411 start_codon:yes stop_codon:yes gene_type:complete